MKKLVLGIAFIAFVGGFSLMPNNANAQSAELTQAGDCHNIRGGQSSEVMGIPACLCGPGLQCLCITKIDCPKE